jgi:hypothetical protein
MIESAESVNRSIGSIAHSYLQPVFDRSVAGDAGPSTRVAGKSAERQKTCNIAESELVTQSQAAPFNETNQRSDCFNCCPEIMQTHTSSRQWHIGNNMRMNLVGYYSVAK